MCCYDIDLGTISKLNQWEQSIWTIWTNESAPLCLSLLAHWTAVMTMLARRTRDGSSTSTLREKHEDTWGLLVCHSEVRFSRGSDPPQISAITLWPVSDHWPLTTDYRLLSTEIEYDQTAQCSLQTRRAGKKDATSNLGGDEKTGFPAEQYFHLDICIVYVYTARHLSKLSEFFSRHNMEL